jgi:iron complex outermembrane recepter protein
MLHKTKRCLSASHILWLLFTLPAVVKGDAPQATADPANPAALKILSLEELSQIDVTTPSKEPVKASRTPAAIYVVTGEDIRRSGVTSIPDALRLAPGVEVAQIDASKWSVGIRGFGSRLTRSVLVMIDGRTVYTTLFAGTYWEVQNVMLEDVDRIEVIRGPGGTIWGPNAVNGVINIITKNAKDTKGILATAGGGTVEQGFGNFRYGGGNDKDFSYRVYGMGFTRAPEDHSDGHNFDDWREAQGGFRMDWNEHDRDLFTLQGDVYDEKAGESVTVSNYNPPSNATVDANAALSGFNVLGRWRRIFSPGNDVQVQFFYDETNRQEPNLDDRRGTFDLDYLQRRKLRWRQEISFGLGARIIPIHDPFVTSGLTFLPMFRTDYLATGFLQDEIGLVENRLSLTLGTKFLRTNFTRGIEPEPSARLLWTPNGKETVWAAFTHALRTPSDGEDNFALSSYLSTTSNGTPFFARFNPNPAFAPEQLNGYELGYRRLLGKDLYIDLTGFYNHYHDLFSEDITGPVFFENSPAPPHVLLPAQFQNDLFGYTKGVEVAPEWRPVAFWRLRGSYSFLHMNLGSIAGPLNLGTAATTGSSPRHQGTIESSFDYGKKLQLDLDWRYVSALPAQSVPAYQTADARIGWRLNRQLEFSLVGRNLLQREHFEDGGDPGPLVGIKRSGYIRLTWSR